MTEEELRAQLRQVDELTPPGTGFEAKALYAGQRRLARRRSWSTGLLGVAAAVVVGSLVVVNVNHPSTTSSGSSAAGVAPDKRADAPSAANGSPGPLQGGSTGGPAGDSSGPSPSTIRPSVGDPGFDFGGQGVPDALAAVSSTLARPPFDDIYSGMRLQTTPTSEARYYLTRIDPAAMAVVTRGLPAGAPVVFIESAYSAKACAVTLAAVTKQVPTLQSQTFPVQDVSCDPLGRVAVVLGPTATDGQRGSLQARYGDTVEVVGADAVPRPTGG